MNTQGDSDGEPGSARAGPQADLHYVAVPAEPQRLPALRRALADWAERVGMNPEQIEALTLATYEALANATAHAYSDSVGVLDVHAAYLPASTRVEVTVTDHGQWRPAPADRGELGGRGLVLIRSLADQAEFETDESGTTVRMAWRVVPHTATARQPTG